MSKIARLRAERDSLMRRIEPGKPGVVALRVRLTSVVHELMRLGG